MTFNFIDYLAAKKSVDDRSLNHHVLESLAQCLEPIHAQGSLHVLEIGTGIGTMFERLIEWNILSNANYTAIDLQPENIAEAAHLLPLWAERLGFRVQQQTAGTMSTPYKPRCKIRSRMICNRGLNDDTSKLSRMSWCS